MPTKLKIKTENEGMELNYINQRLTLPELMPHPKTRHARKKSDNENYLRGSFKNSLNQ